MAVEFSKRQVGQNAEDCALAYLEDQGLQLPEKNYYRPCGEIDLIMQDQDTLVFVEVRKRKDQHFGRATDSIDRRKQQKIIKTALLYLQKTKQLYTHFSRFDVIGLDANNQIEWIKGAFGIDFV